jgi:hypothetical protein
MADIFPGSCYAALISRVVIAVFPPLFGWPLLPRCLFPPPSSPLSSLPAELFPHTSRVRLLPVAEVVPEPVDTEFDALPVRPVEDDDGESWLFELVSEHSGL